MPETLRTRHGDAHQTARLGLDYFERVILAFAFLVVVLTPQLVQAQSLTRDGRLKIISYNVQFLPQIVSFANKRPLPKYRAATIGKALADYDIVGLNELFAETPRDLLVAELQKTWGDSFHSFLSPKVDEARYAGGLAIFSRLPFVDTNVHTYVHFSKLEERGIKADGFVTKGVLHARLATTVDRDPKLSIDLFVTHLESQDAKARAEQYVEFADFVKLQSSPDRPVILMGDFNTRGDQEHLERKDSAYHRLTGLIQEARPESPLVDLWTSLGKGPGGTSDQLIESGGSRIDYIFTMNSQSSLTQLDATEVKVNRFHDAKVIALSDHSAVEAVLQVKQASTSLNLTSLNSTPLKSQQLDATNSEKLPRLVLIGDSTVKNGSGKGNDTLWGWGQVLEKYFDATKIQIENRALGGRSSRSYLTEGHWEKSLERLRPGDFLLIQFGHNDGGQMFEGDRPRASIKGNSDETTEGVVAATGEAETVHSYGWYLRKYVSDAKAKGAIPIIISLIPRNRWEGDKVIRSSEDYAKWAKEAAKQSGADFIDLNDRVATFYEKLGKENVGKMLFTEKDWTHTTQAGAEMNAAQLALAIHQSPECTLREYLTNDVRRANFPTP